MSGMRFLQLSKFCQEKFKSEKSLMAKQDQERLKKLCSNVPWTKLSFCPPTKKKGSRRAHKVGGGRGEGGRAAWTDRGAGEHSFVYFQKRVLRDIATTLSAFQQNKER